MKQELLFIIFIILLFIGLQSILNGFDREKMKKSLKIQAIGIFMAVMIIFNMH